MSGMFGAPIGIRAAEQDTRNSIQGGLQALAGLADLEAKPAELDLKRAQVRRQTAEAATLEAELSDVQALQKVMAGVEGGPVERLTAAADYMLSRGKAKAGGDILGKASQLIKDEAQTASAEALQRKRTLETTVAQAQRAASIAQSATDPASYARARLAAEAEGMDVRDWPMSFYEAQPVLQQKINQALTAAQKATLEQQELDRGFREAQAKALNAYRGARLRQINEQIKTTQEREARIAKAEGENAPSLRELRQTLTELNRARTQLTESQIPPPEGPSRLSQLMSKLTGKKPTIPLPASRDASELIPGQIYSDGKQSRLWGGDRWLDADMEDDDE